jgi:UDP-N-acetylglucosamine 2-epimerase (non-hydrolysing)
MKLAIVYGTRPEFIKLKCLIDLLRNKVELFVVKINQHAHYTEDAGYYNSLLEIDEGSERMSMIGSSVLVKLPDLIRDCTHILAQGDTASVFYSLLCGFQMKKVCIHLEAGMRTYDLENPFPEEGYRQMISRITDIHLCPSEVEERILKAEKVKGSIYVVGNTILDLVKSYDYHVMCEKKALITLHRRENWSDFKDYIIELAALASRNSEYSFYFLTHPNPSFKEILDELVGIIPKNMIIMESLPHRELIKVLAESSFVITDSGGIQEEANYLGKHIYVLRKVTERQAIHSSKITLYGLDDIKRIECKDYGHLQGFEYGCGESCEEILKVLLN